MFSYRYMFMEMDGIYDGSNSVSSPNVFAQNYVVTPRRMTMEMHMLGAMYAPSDKLTLSAMVPYVLREMDHVISPGAAPLLALNNGSDSFTTKSEGFGDLRLSGLYRLVHKGGHHFHAGMGVSLPTGAINENDETPGPGGLLARQLPAAMQNGSGTFDLLPSLTYTYIADCWSVGVQGAGTVRTGRNSHGYRFGDRFDLNTWISYYAAEWVSVNAGMAYIWEDELHGEQSDVLRNPPFAPTRLTVPTAFSENYGGQRVEALAGVNFVIPSGILKNHRLAVDVRVPLWQDRNGISLGTNYTLTGGWQYSF